jgi:hypothetical protein
MARQYHQFEQDVPILFNHLANWIAGLPRSLDHVEACWVEQAPKGQSSTFTVITIDDNMYRQKLTESGEAQPNGEH